MNLPNIPEKNWGLLEQEYPDTANALQYGITKTSMQMLDITIQREHEALAAWERDKRTYRFGEAAWSRDPDPSGLEQIRNSINEFLDQTFVRDGIDEWDIIEIRYPDITLKYGSPYQPRRALIALEVAFDEERDAGPGFQPGRKANNPSYFSLNDPNPDRIAILIQKVSEFALGQGCEKNYTK